MPNIEKRAVEKSLCPRAKWATKRTLACIEVRSVVFLESFQLERRLSISSGAIVRIVLGRHGKTCALGNEKSGVFCFICVSFPRGFVVVLSWFWHFSHFCFLVRLGAEGIGAVDHSDGNREWRKNGKS